MICNKCGKTNTETATKCAFCGEALPKTTDCGGFKDILNFTPSEAPQGMPSQAQPQSDPYTKRILEHCEALSKKAKKDKITALIAAGVAAVLFITTIVSSVISTAVITGEVKKLHSEASEDTEDKKAETTDAQTDTAKPTDTGDAVTSGTQGETINQSGTAPDVVDDKAQDTFIFTYITDNGILENDTEINIENLNTHMNDDLGSQYKNSKIYVNGELTETLDGIQAGDEIILHRFNNKITAVKEVKIAVSGDAITTENKIKKGESFEIKLTQTKEWIFEDNKVTITSFDDNSNVSILQGVTIESAPSIKNIEFHNSDYPVTDGDGIAHCKISEDEEIKEIDIHVTLDDKTDVQLFISDPSSFTVIEE